MLDMSLAMFVWNHQEAKPMFNATESQGMCVDWETVMSSAARRVVSNEEIKRLVSPLLNTTP